jgi:hypothetical protein
MIGTPRLRDFAQRAQHARMVGAGIVADAEQQSQWSKSSSDHRALADADRLGRPTLVASWHMLEQSGKLLVPYSRANN